MKRVTLLILTALMGVSHHAWGQTAEQMILLQKNPGLAETLKSQINNQKNLEAPSAGVPTSKEPRELNATDSLTDPSIVTQSIAPADSKDSVIQRYYRVLSEQSLPIYGSSEFSQKQDKSILFFNTMGKDYRLAAGDVVQVTIRGRTMGDATHKIGRDGNLILPSIAPVLVSGSTITEAEEKLLDILVLDDAAAAAFISLETARLITVQVSGAVASPRTIAVPAYTPLSRVLAYSGGIKSTGSLRNIILRDQDGKTQSIDFYDFLQSPAGSNDPLVTDSSRIFVGNQGKTIGAVGYVARPGIYELQEGSNNISVAELLKLTGTSVIPPGAEFEALFFDENGITSKRKIDRSGFLHAGEVLDLRFMETNLQNSIEVLGAVLSEYKLASTKPISLQKLLKNGNVLQKNLLSDKGNAVLDFALLISNIGETRTISLRDKLQDPSFFISPNTKLVVLNTAQYKKLLNTNSDRTDDPLLSFIEQSDRAQLFVNGKKIAFIPPTEGKLFSDVLKYYYSITPKTSLDLAIIESSSGQAQSVSLRSLLDSNEPRTISAGERFHLFETSFLQQNSDNLDAADPTQTLAADPTQTLAADTTQTLAADPTQTPGAIRGSDWIILKRLFSRANVIQVKVDDEIRGFLPESAESSPSTAADLVGFDNLSTLADIVLLESKSKTTRNIYHSATFSTKFSMPDNQKLVSIQLFRSATLKNIINDSYSITTEKLKNHSVSVYVDFNLVSFGLADDLNHQQSNFYRRITDSKIYPLFALHRFVERQDSKSTSFWASEALSLKSISDPQLVDRIKPRDEIYIFTNTFIREMSRKGFIAAEGDNNIENLPIEAPDKKGIGNLTEGTTTDQRKRGQQLERFALNEKIKVIKSFARFIGGAVGTPGSYPAADAISLAELISVAGGLTGDADIQNISLTTLKQAGSRIVPDKVQKLNLTTTPATQVTLSGLYNVVVPPFINDASTGVVTLTGEVERPGQYVIGRDETLHDLIDRAGGLSSVAYPLGAVFTRESLKANQKEGNDLLARQVEEAVLKISQSEDNKGVGDQIAAVVGYAKQLREQEVSGRLTVNVLQRNKSSPVYMQDGDVLTIPKRPGHVSIIGSVQKNTVASYSEGKRLSSYLASAGGTNRVADRGLTYIVLPNGESDSVDNDSIIPPGSVIVVPPKTDRISILSFTEIVSRVLGNIALSFLAINNAR